jgi:hypothetical protein
MKYAALFLLAIPAFAQLGSRPTPAAASMPPNAGAAALIGAPKTARIPLATFVSLERGFDAKLSAISDSNGPVDLLGATRGVYLDGYGVVFTSEMGLIVTPAITPFTSAISEEQKKHVHSSKVTRLPLLRKAVTDMVRNIAGSLTQVADQQQIVVAVRLDYMKWENTAGLPGLVMAKADRRSAMAGNIQLEEQY